MAKRVQVRGVPDTVHRTLKARAAHSGISLSEYLRSELALIAARPTPEEVRGRSLNLSGYDAVYVALADALGVSIITTDKRLAAAAGRHTPVPVVLLS